jgi:hypothetical protein
MARSSVVEYNKYNQIFHINISFKKLDVNVLFNGKMIVKVYRDFTIEGQLYQHQTQSICVNFCVWNRQVFGLYRLN